MISFIIPLNERKLDRLPGLYYNISKYYDYPNKDNYEIIIIEQNKNEPFKLGQNRNIGFNKSNGSIIVFLDVDIRFKNYIDFDDMLKKSKNRPIICWKYITQVDEDPIYNLIERQKDRKIEGLGKAGCIAFTRQQFIDSCGYSNLMIGWGKEDEMLFYRSNIIRENSIEIYHVFHKDKREKWGIKDDKIGEALDRNVKIVKMYRDEKIILKQEDGFNQTMSDCSLLDVKYKEFYRHYFVSNIGVTKNFKYMKLYEEMNLLIG
jgi:predicted glycosyltransferase involved in capsule biosynthesis